MAFREASSLILTSLKSKPFTSLYNYQILMLKRSQKSSFMPNSSVFPGGALDPADSSPKWLDLFKSIGYTTETTIAKEKLPTIFTSDNGVNKDVALRIAAIRETFEETGVFICKHSGSSKCIWSEVCKADVSSWRSKVQDKPSAFLELCESLQCVPDIWSLKLWSNWLTPPIFQKRFDTVFYTACLQEQPEGTVDSTENSEMAWYSPERLKALNEQGQMHLPPPQVYELGRLSRFYMLEDLASFADWREQFGCDRYDNPVRMPTKEGLIFPLPGDDLLQETDPEVLAEETFESARKRSKFLHRLEIVKDGRCKVVVENVEPSKGHVLPIPTRDMKQCCKM